VPAWCKGLVDLWLCDSGVTDGRLFRRVLKNGSRLDADVTANVVWYAVNDAPSMRALIIWHRTTFVAVAHVSAMALEVNSNRFSFSSDTHRCKRQNAISDASRSSERRSMIASRSHSRDNALRAL
jgi:hypothetical protein